MSRRTLPVSAACLTPVKTRSLPRAVMAFLFKSAAATTFSEDAAAAIIGDNITHSLQIADGSFGKKRKRIDGSSQYNEHVKYLLSRHRGDPECGDRIDLAPTNVAVDVSTQRAIQAMNIPVLTASGPLCVPMASVDDDNKELVFDRPGVPLCTSQLDCVANLIQGPPSKPLGAYRGPGHDPASNYCLLCIRNQLGMLVHMHRAYNGDSRPPVGVYPPFANPVDVVGGYRSAFCAVTPKDMQCVSGGIHIMGPPVGFSKRYSPYTKQWFVDQSVAVYGAVDFFF
jgi:hypothetical protein